MRVNLTVAELTPQWNSKPMYKLPPWGEPLIVLSILVGSMILTRRRNYQVFGSQKADYHNSFLGSPSSASSVENLLSSQIEGEHVPFELSSSFKHLPKRRRCYGLAIETPNTSRFLNHLHSRVLQKFPFLIEMFYWIITYLLYRMTKVLSQKIFSKSVWDVAQDHGLAVLDMEQFSSISLLFPIKERDVQHWFMESHQTALTVLNRAYALIHIPGTVGFIAWYYHVARSHTIFATVRRTLTLTNLFAFLTFTLFPCMPPRLLPPEYGFVDSVRHDNAASIWMSGDFVNSLAAMPSMHFGYAFVIGCTLFHHSGVFRSALHSGEVDRPLVWQVAYACLGVLYPCGILLTIVATANHYWLDALVAAIVASVAYFCNGAFLALLPLEDLLLWALRLEKPVPTTGIRYRSKRARGSSVTV